ncbi:glutaredoxin family protein [Moorella sp. Hama-1]|uniref:glutaredoxin family protein n=1 Tax=Moorella sp. Hama-1 TaxID=2138101 RepID=UPI000D64B47B|nr:glutaredoxin family protein [Moorella sp. Hama-1]BCV22057.1 NrdH-redoxin [Moorella sp. Hama-1]
MTIKLYALSTCPYCMKTKQLLNEQGATYDLIDVDLAPDEVAARALEEVRKLTGQQSFPVIVINDRVIRGYHREEILAALSNEQ